VIADGAPHATLGDPKVQELITGVKLGSAGAAHA
jgi:hypothetical protein